MKIAIVEQMEKDGKWYCAYKVGLLSRLGIFCPSNKIPGASGRTPERCIELAKSEIEPDPPPNHKLIDVVEI